MVKYRYYMRNEAKCNFCFDWFESLNPIKNSLHLCSPCIEKALNSRCYQVPSPDGSTWYQLYLFKNNLNVYGVKNDEEVEGMRYDDFCKQRNTLLDEIDDFRDQEMREVNNKWRAISDRIEKIDNFKQKEF